MVREKVKFVTLILAAFLGAFVLGTAQELHLKKGSSGGGGAPVDAQYWVGAANGTLSAEKDLSGFTALVLNTIGTPSAYTGIDCTDQFVRDVNGSGVGTCNSVGTNDVSNDAITYAKVQNVSATSRVLGRVTAGAGDTEELTVSQVLDFVGSAADGDILIRSAGAWTRLAKGTAGQVLRMNSGATLPEWGMAGQQTVVFGIGAGSGFNPTTNINHFLYMASAASNNASVAANYGTPIVRRAGTITDVYLLISVAGTNGSNQTGTGLIRVNNTTDTIVFNNTLLWDGAAAGKTFSATGLSIALAVGDFFQFKLDPPTWGTVPTSVFYICQVVVTFP